jgi:hypothetical protein
MWRLSFLSGFVWTPAEIFALAIIGGESTASAQVKAALAGEPGERKAQPISAW